MIPSARYGSFILILLFCVPSTSAQELPVTWSPEVSMSIKAVQGTAVSPDGQHVCYVVREPLMEGEQSEYRTQLWMASAGQQPAIQFTFGDHSANAPAFSPDGSRLAFISSRGGTNQVFVMYVRGGEARPVTDASSGVSSFKWAPDGKRIAFIALDPESEETKQANKEKRDVILVDQEFRYGHLYVQPVDLTSNEIPDDKQVTSGAMHVQSFDWSPDGTTLVFSHQDDPRINTGRSHSDIALVPADSGGMTPLVSRPGSDTNPLFSPDGTQVAFSTHGGTVDDIGLSDIHTVSITGGSPQPLPLTPDRNASLLAWNREGNAVFVSESSKTNRQVLALPVGGEIPDIVLPPEGIYSSVSFSADGNAMAFSFEDLDSPQEVYAAPVGGFQRQQVSSINDHLELPELGKTELITWSSPDGTPVEGLLTYPVAYEPGQSVPLILNIHGGPAGVYSQHYTGRPGIYMYQYFAQQGYATLRPNPRGSTGYGKEFRNANVMDWGYGDYEDVMSGVDKVIEMGIGHPDSLAVMGWSYGGYLTSFLVTRTSRFKAASMGAGLPNLISMVTTTDIGDYLAAHMGGEFWDDYETYEKHSAIYRIKNVTTPTQVIHGAEDLRVPFTQGQEFYRALQRLGVDTEMVVYPRTPHGPREPKFTMDVSERILTWFDHHLGRNAVPVAADE